MPLSALLVLDLMLLAVLQHLVATLVAAVVVVHRRLE